MDNTLDHTFESANRVYAKNGACPTIPTNSGGDHVPKVIEETRCVGGLSDNQWGKQYHQQDRVYKGDIALAHPANLPEGSYKYVMKEEIEIKQATKEGSIKCKVGGCYDSSYPASSTRRGRVQNGGDVTPTITAQGGENINYVEGVKNYEEKGIREVLYLLRSEIGTESFQKWTLRGLYCFLKKEVLQQRVYAESLLKNWEQSTELGQFTSNSERDKSVINPEEELRNMWEDWESRCTPYRRKLSEQQNRKLDDFMQKLSHQDTQAEEIVFYLWETSEGVRLLRETLSEIQKIWESFNDKQGTWTRYRIRKLTPRETWRLMGYTDADFDKAQGAGVSNSQLYKQAGNAIVKQVLMAIFMQMHPKLK